MKKITSFSLMVYAYLIVLGCSPKPVSNLQFFDFDNQLNWSTTEKPLFPKISAHRGGMTYKGYPENGLETFEHVYQQTKAIIECDISITADDVLILMHDKSLDRTTNATGKVQSKTWAEIQHSQLKDHLGNLTPYKIPTLETVLKWGKANDVLFTLDIKRGVPFEKVINMVQKFDYFPQAAIITYTLADAQLVHQLAPEAYISISIRNEAELQRVLASGIDLKQVIAFTGTSVASPELYQKLNQLKVPTILGTLGNLDNQAAAKGDKIYQKYIDMGVNILATNRPLEASKIVGLD